MDINRYISVESQIIEKAMAIAKRKRPGYTQGSADVLDNFKRHGKEMGVSPAIAWYMLASKHWDDITFFCKNTDGPRSENLVGRIADLINFAIMLAALAIDLGVSIGPLFEDEQYDTPTAGTEDAPVEVPGGKVSGEGDTERLKWETEQIQNSTRFGGTRP